MLRILALVAALTLAAQPAAAQPAAAQPVQVSPLPAPDAFSTPGRATGLGQDLWRGASADTLQTVLPLLARRPLTPAAMALARRVLATGAPGPNGVGADPGFLSGRVNALLALGDPRGAGAILTRAPGLERNPELSRTAAESALLVGDDARACAVGEALTVGRDEVYWLRLRAYCLAIAGQTAQAQLTFDLAQAQTRDPVFARLMAAKLAGSGSPGAASLRNGLDYALSRSLGLDLGDARPAPAVAAALAAPDPAEPAWSLPEDGGDVAVAGRALAAGQPLPAGLMERLLDAAAQADAKSRPRLETAVLLLAGLVEAPGPDLRGRLAALSILEAGAPVGRHLALAAAAEQKLTGEAAILALWICADAGGSGPGPAARARIVRALRAAGLAADARNFAVEGLLAAA